MVNQDVDEAVRDPCNRVDKPSGIDRPLVDAGKGGKANSSDEEGVVLNGIGVRRLVAPQHVELPLADLARPDCFVSVFDEIVPGRFIVVDAVPLLQCARGKNAIGPDEVKAEESWGVV